jgi:DNA-binding response OmpR family regulator
LDDVSTAADIRALIVTPDLGLASVFRKLSQELGIVTEVSDPGRNTPFQLGREKYEALVVDLDSIRDVAPTLNILRANSANRGAVILAVASENPSREEALKNGVNFVLRRPVDNKELRRTLYAAYDAMTQERRRYFRCSAELPVFLARSDGSDLVAKTGNVSANGMSIQSSVSFALGERVGITLDLQSGGPHVLARGVVVWDDKHGKSGLRFECVRPELQNVLDAWLDTRFKEMRRESIRDMQTAESAHSGRSF